MLNPVSISHIRVATTVISINLDIQTLLHFTLNSSCSSKLKALIDRTLIVLSIIYKSI